MTSKSETELVTFFTMMRNFWVPRQLRFQRDQQLYQLEKPMTSTAWTHADSDIVILNDPKVLIKKVSRILARHPATIEVPANGPENKDIAQRIENWLYAWDQSINHQWMRGLHNPYRYDQAFFLTLRGWLATRTMFNPSAQLTQGNPGAMYDHQVIDPVNVFPWVVGNEIVRVVHHYEARVAQLVDDPVFMGLRQSGYSDDQSQTLVNVQGHYWKDAGSWWYALMVNNEFVKKPIELGYNPWTITLANGAAYRSTPWDTSQDFVENIGTGLLDETADNQVYLNRVVSKLNALLSLEANPPMSIFADGQIKRIDTQPGARMFFTQKDRLEAHRFGPNFADFQLLWNILTERMEHAGLPKAFYGEAAETGFASAVVMSAGRDILFPFTEALNVHDEMTYEKDLELYRDFGPSTPLVARMPPDAMGASLYAEITAQDINAQGTYVEVTREDMTPTELAQKITLAQGLVRDKIISLETARGKEWVGVKNPQKENLQVIAEQVYTDPKVIAQLTPLALSDTGQTLLASIWSMTQNPLPPEGQEQPFPAGQPTAPGATGGPGANPMNTLLGGPPPQPPMMPGQIMPPVMQTGDLLTSSPGGPNSGLNALLATMTGGGAQGGAGAGGTPPPAGSVPGARPLPTLQELLGARGR